LDSPGKKWHYQRFVKGKPVAAVKTVSFPADVKKLLPYMPTRGTVIRFKPDQSVVSTNGGKTKAKLDIAYTARAMRDMAMLNPGIELVLSANGKTKSFVNRDGLIGLVKRRILDLDLETMGKPFVHNSEKLSVAIQWTSYPEDTGLDTYVNSGQTVEHGEHELGFRNALTKALLQYKKKTDKFGPKDQYFGLIGIVNWKMSGAAFSGQTKSKLTSNVSAALEQELLPALTTFFAKNQSLARSIIRRAAAVKKSKG
jgi:Type IIA topoisomerase (DNA gyrase/topo II, topoisomerase IV), B subunit